MPSGYMERRKYFTTIGEGAQECCVKVKKLRQQYIKVRDASQKSGSSSDVKDKFVWFDDLDKILNTRPVVSPVDVVESYEEEGAKSTACTSLSLNQESTSSVHTEMDSRSSSVDGEDSDKSGDPAAGLNKDYGQPSEQHTDQSQQIGKRWAIPGAASRKKRPKTCLDSRHVLSTFLTHPTMPSPPAIPTPSTIPTTSSSSPPSLSTPSPRSTPSVNQELVCQQPIPLTVILEEENAGPSISFI